ncbi:MAG: hypothetical protein K6F51_13300 [Acetatifactor sp.]|nr:hypothetical protein [Acetatifactor sp.]
MRNNKAPKTYLKSLSPFLVFVLLIFLESEPFLKCLTFVIDFYKNHKLFSWILFVLLVAIIFSINPLKRCIIKHKSNLKANNIILVKQNSRKYQQLLSINARYAFQEIPKTMEFHRRLESNKDYDRYDMEAFFYESICENYQEILAYQKKSKRERSIICIIL